MNHPYGSLRSSERFAVARDSLARRLFPLTLAPSFALAALLYGRAARAGDVEVQLAAGPTTYATTWHGDYGAGGTLRAGARMSHVVSADVEVWESMATINERVNTGLSVGVTGYLPLRVVHPYLRVFALHQHEEGLVSVVYTPAGFLFGIGSGIRHRAGGGLCLGTQVPIGRTDGGRLSWVLFGDAMTIWFPDPTLGPSAYVGLDLGVGFDFVVK
jgi:hypothetical protein